MSTVIEAPRTLVESVAAMRFPPKTDALLQSRLPPNPIHPANCIFD